MNKNTQEKRQYPRLNAKYPVSYGIKDGNPAYDLSQTKNISQGGVLFNTDCLFEPGAILTLSLHLPFTVNKVLTTAVVVSSREIIKEYSLYETRAKFVRFDPVWWSELGKLVKEKTK